MMNELIGRNLGSYQVIQELGRGGMAIVYRAYQPSLQRHVAIKVLLPHMAADPAFVQRFLREARAAARLKHPNIVTIYDVGEADGRFYIVMEELSGQPLSTRLQSEGKLSLAQATHLLRQVASALDYAHSQGIVHRDIKPSNIIVGPGDRVTLVDFGIAKVMDGGAVTQSRTLVGTPQYMAPEQIKGEAVGPAADIYALGIVLYEMLAGQVPFRAESITAVMYKQVHELPPSLGAVAPAVPPAADQVLQRALAKNPGQRFRTATEMAQLLEGIARDQSKPLLASEPTRAYHDLVQPTKPLPQPLRLLRWVLGAGAVTIVVLLLVFMLSSQHVANEPSTPPSVVIALPASTAAPTTPALGTLRASSDSVESTVPARPASRSAVVLSSQDVNVYAGPGRDYAIVGLLASDEQKDILGQTADGAWLMLCCVAGEPAWVQTMLVEFVGPTSTIPVLTAPVGLPTSTSTLLPMSTLTLTAPEVVVGTNAANVRTGPGVEYPQIGRARQGEVYAITGRNADASWWQIVFQGRLGWIAAGLVNAYGPLDDMAAIEAPPVLTAEPVFIPLSLGAVANATTSDGYETPPSGRVELGGVVFEMPPGINSVTTQAEPLPENPTQVVVRAGVHQPTHVYLLMTGGDLYTQYQNQIIGVVRLEFTSSQPQSLQLVAGRHLREWKLDTAATIRDSSQSIEVFRALSKHGGVGVIDMLTITVLPDRHLDTLERIVIEDWSQQTVNSLDPAINLLGVTVRGQGQ